MTDSNQQELPSAHSSHKRAFVAVFLMLCALTAASFWLANSDMMVQSKGTARACLIAVSAAKAMLVVTFFMHLWWEKSWKYVLTLPALILSVVLVLLLIPDIGLRTESYSLERKQRAPLPQLDSHDDDPAAH